MIPTELEDLTDGLASGIQAEQVEGLDEAAAIVPVFGLMRGLFSTSPTDTALKLVVLFALTQVEGRFTRERIRSLVRSLDSDRLDALVTSLYGSGWLELRAVDNTYRMSPLGLYLLSVLRAANFASQSPANLLVRAVEVLQFGDRIDDRGATTARLLGMLLAELETQAEHAREVIARGRPRQLVRFSRQEVAGQLEHVRHVLAAIETRLDEASHLFGRVVRIHEAIQSILRAHEGLGRRLSEWNLKRLETTGAGYSLTALCDAALGASDEELEHALHAGVVSPPAPAVGLSTDGLLDRYEIARRERVSPDAFEYEPPPEPEVEALELEDVDPIARLRRALLALAEPLAPGEAIPLDAWIADHAGDFAEAVFQLGLVARIEGRTSDTLDGPGWRLRVQSPDSAAENWRGLDPEATLRTLQELGRLVRVPGRGLHSAITLVKDADD